MKFNINFDWAVLTSIFTIFLYWCGYFYTAGALDYFSYNIEIFDLPVSSILIQGALHATNDWIKLIFGLVIFSFLRSFSTKQWAFFFLNLLRLSINLFIVLYNISIFYYIKKFATNYRVVHQVITYTSSNVPTFKAILGPPYQFLKKRLVKKNRKIKIYTYLMLKRAKLTTRTINAELNNGMNTSTPHTMKFEVSTFVHYGVLLTVLIIILSCFQVGGKLLNQAKEDTKVYFLNTRIDYNKRLKNPNTELKKNEKAFPEVEIQGKVSKDKLFLTNTCFKSMCLVTDIHKNVKLYDVKDIKVLNNDS